MTYLIILILLCYLKIIIINLYEHFIKKSPHITGTNLTTAYTRGNIYFIKKVEYIKTKFISLKFTTNDKQKFFDIETEFLYGKESSKGRKTKMIPDLNSNNILLGVKSTKSAEFQNECQSLEKDGCVSEGNSEEFNYRGNLIQTQNAKLITNIFKTINPNEELLKEELPAKVIKSVSEWDFGKQSILGLGPNSPFFNYLLKTNDLKDDILRFSFFYTTKFEEEKFEPEPESYRSSQFILGGLDYVHSKDDVPIFWTENKREDSWVLENVSFYIGDKLEPVFLNQKVCVSNQAHEVLSSKLSNHIHNQINLNICGASTCSGASEELRKKAPTLKFEVSSSIEKNEIQKKIISLEPEDYLNVKNEKAEPSLGDLEMYHNQSICAGYDHIVGVLFLTKHLLVFEADKNNRRRIGIGSFLQIKLTVAQRSFMISLGIGSNLFLILLLVIKMIVLGRKKKNDVGVTSTVVDRSSDQEIMDTSLLNGDYIKRDDDL